MKEMDGLKWKVTFVDAWAMGDEREREGGRERERERERASELNKPCTASSYFMQLAQFDNRTRARARAGMNYAYE